jgi:hypothetical protein
VRLDHVASFIENGEPDLHFKIASSVARLGLRNRRQTDLITLILCFIDSSSAWLREPTPSRSGGDAYEARLMDLLALVPGLYYDNDREVAEHRQLGFFFANEH